MSDRKDLPPVTSSNFLARVREELAIMMGNRGEPLDEVVRFNDLQSSNLVTVGPGYAGGGSGRPIISGLGPAVAPVYVPDLTPPPTPTGFMASAAISNLFVGHDGAAFTVGHGYLRTILYGASRTSIYAAVPTFANAVQLVQFVGTVAAYPTNPSTIWHLWIKWMSVDGAMSESPAGGTNGLSVTTGQDVTLLLTALTGQIRDSQLFSDLGARINLIDTPGTGLIARVSSEVLTRTNETGVLAGRIDSVQAIATTDRTAAAAAITGETTARANADSAMASRVDTVQAVATSDRGTFSSAIATEQTARANADGTLFAQYSVKVDVNGYVSGFGLSSTAIDAVPTSAFAVRADQFYIASPSGPGIGPTVPFIVRTTPTTINGIEVPVGVYLQDAFIANASIGQAKIASVRADSILTGVLQAVISQTGVIFNGVNAYTMSTNQSTLVVTATPTGQAPGTPGFGTGYYLGTLGGSPQLFVGSPANHLLWNGSALTVRGTIYASAGQIGSCNIGADGISSANYNGTNGWSINQNGSAYFGSVSLRGRIASGGFTGFGFPPSGQTGFYLGPEGLLLGNANDGRYVVIRANGNFESPQFNIVNGVATFAGALQGASGTFSGSLTAAAVNAVQTVNIGANAATVTVSAQTPNSSAEVSISLAYPATVQLIGQTALPNGASPFELQYRASGSATFDPAGYGSETVTGIGVLCARLSLAAGSWDFRLYSPQGVRSTIIALATIR